MPDTQAVVRHWLLLKALSIRSPGVTVKELAAELNVSEKTIRRDLITLQSVGFPVEEATGEFGRKSWRIDAKWPHAEMSFQFDEALALSFGQRMLEPLAGTYFWEAAQRAFKKIRASLGRPALRYLEKMATTFHHTHTGISDYSKHAQIIDQILLGIEDRKVVFITYQSAQATEPVTYDIHPYGLSYHRGSLYVVGFAPQHNELRIWKVDRIESADVDAMPFPRPANFDLAQHFADSFGVFQGKEKIHVKIRFAPTVARYVKESNWHASQQLTPQPDGSLIAEFQLSSTQEIKAWALSFGLAAEVLAPAELREQIGEELRQLTSVYETAPLPAKPLVATSKPSNRPTIRKKGAK